MSMLMRHVVPKARRVLIRVVEVCVIMRRIRLRDGVVVRQESESNSPPLFGLILQLRSIVYKRKGSSNIYYSCGSRE
jgi:hypothetical protein